MERKKQQRGPFLKPRGALSKSIKKKRRVGRKEEKRLDDIRTMRYLRDKKKGQKGQFKKSDGKENHL